jgi:hypothetical protein
MHQAPHGALLRNNKKKIRVIRSIRFIRSKTSVSVASPSGSLEYLAAENLY